MSVQLVALSKDSQLNRVRSCHVKGSLLSLTKEDRCHKLPFQTEQKKKTSHNPYGEESDNSRGKSKGGGSSVPVKRRKMLPSGGWA